MLKIAICEKSRKTQKLFARLSNLAHFRICLSLQSLEQKYLLNCWNFYFSAKNQRFSAKIGQNQLFWPKIRDFSLKNKNFKNLKDIFVLMIVKTNISENEPNRTIWQRVFAFFVIFHKSRFSASDADFLVKIIRISLNFHFFAFTSIIFKSIH